MNSNFGPWATAISSGDNPQLSTFWKRRLSMLSFVNKNNSTFNRKSLFCLVAVAVAIWTIPTFSESSTQAGPPAKISDAKDLPLDAFQKNSDQRLQRLEKQLQLLASELKAIRSTERKYPSPPAPELAPKAARQYVVKLKVAKFEKAGQAVQSTTLAEPTMALIDGRSAQFLSGGEAAVAFNKDGRQEIEYLPFGLSTDITVRHVSDGKVFLRLFVNQGERILSANASSVPNDVLIQGKSIRLARTVKLGAEIGIVLEGTVSTKPYTSLYITIEEAK